MSPLPKRSLPRMPRFGASKLVSTWIIAMLAVSIVAQLDGGFTASWLALAPSRIWHGQIWRLVTWSLLEPSARSLIFACISIFQFGSELAGAWGERRLRRVMIEILAGVAVVTTLLGFVLPAIGYAWFPGGWATSDALCILWARTFPDRPLQLYGMITLHGRDLIKITVGITALYALFSGIVWLTPALLACAAAYAYPRSRWRQ